MNTDSHGSNKQAAPPSCRFKVIRANLCSSVSGYFFRQNQDAAAQEWGSSTMTMRQYLRHFSNDCHAVFE
jgi:hypothetical protein